MAISNNTMCVCGAIAREHEAQVGKCTKTGCNGLRPIESEPVDFKEIMTLLDLLFEFDLKSQPEICKTILDKIKVKVRR